MIKTIKNKISSRLCFFFLGLIVFALPNTSHATLSEETFKSLLAGELVIYFRHGATTWSGVDQLDWPRDRQRLLSEKGIEQSETIGKQFQRLGLPVGEVMASPFARCRDMAEIAFGRVDERMELLGLLSDSEGRADRVAFLKEQVSTSTSDQGNRIVIAHRSNIQNVTGSSLAEGEAVLVRPLGNSEFEVLETLMPQDWAKITFPQS